MKKYVTKQTKRTPPSLGTTHKTHQEIKINTWPFPNPTGYYEADRDYRVRLHYLHTKRAGDSTWKIAHTKQNQQIYISFKWDVLGMWKFGLRLKILIKVKNHKSDDVLDFLSVICYALKCHGQ